jgi:uncharacterized protein with PIN domain
MSARLRVHGALEALVLPRWRGDPCEPSAERTATLKHLIEAIGVPHTEVGEVHLDGRKASLDDLLDDAHVVDVFPWPPASANRDASTVTAAPLRFLADAHLGALARDLRLLGFDTLLADDEADARLAGRSRDEGRILLTRDRELLNHRSVRSGCFVLSTDRDQQLAQLGARFDLRGGMQPFTRCLECNGVLHAVARAQVERALPPAVSASQDAFTRCDGCGRVYWRGSHWVKLNARVQALGARLG